MTTLTFDDVANKLFGLSMLAIHTRALKTSHLTYSDIDVLYYWFIIEACTFNREMFLDIMTHATPGINSRDTEMLDRWTSLKELDKKFMTAGLA